VLELQEFTYRTFNPEPTEYERQLAEALFSIMGTSAHGPDAIAAELNRQGPGHPDAVPWSSELLKAEVKRLGTWTNSIGGPVGTHSIPGASGRQHG